jgi:hypothetical protein
VAERSRGSGERVDDQEGAKVPSLFLFQSGCREEHGYNPPGLIVKQQPVRGQWKAGRGGGMEKEGSMTMKGSAEGKKSVVDDG